MGYRLHVAKKYDVEYSNGEWFNHKCEELHNLLTALDVNYTGESYDDEFEVSKKDWIKGINKLKNYDNLNEIEKDDIAEAIHFMRDYEIDEIIKSMDVILERSDPSLEYLHFSFF